MCVKLHNQKSHESPGPSQDNRPSIKAEDSDVISDETGNIRLLDALYPLAQTHQTQTHRTHFTDFIAASEIYGV